MTEMMTAKTYMLRRYELAEGTANEFVTWWTARIPPLRRRAGFTIEYAFLDRDNETFTWLLSHPGDRATFEDADARYQAVPERAAAMAVAPPLRGTTVEYPERII